MHDDNYVTIRVATPDDDRDLRRLAELDSAPRLSGRVLLAEGGRRPLQSALRRSRADARGTA
jgi:hypothetical protein